MVVGSRDACREYRDIVSMVMVVVSEYIKCKLVRQDTNVAY